MSVNQIKFDLFSTDQNRKVFDLIKLPCNYFVTATDKWHCQYWTKGKTHSLSAKSIGDMMKKISSVNLNELSINCKNVTISSPNGKTYSAVFDGHLDVSPTSELWDSVWDYELEKWSEEQRRMSYESKECSLRANGILACPSLYSFSLRFDKMLEGESFCKNYLFDKIKSIENIDMPCDFLGGVSLGQQSHDFLEHPLYSLAPWPKTYPMIGQYVDRLRSLTICSETLCRHIKEALSLPDNNFATILSPHSPPMGVLHIPMTILTDESLIRQASDFIVPKNETTKSYSYGSCIGEFPLRNGGICTLRRLKELLRKKIMPKVRQNQIIDLVLPEKYCKLLGVDPDDMLASIFQKQWLELFSSQLDICFNELSDVVNVKQRLALAYEAALKTKSLKILYFDLLKQLFLT